MKTPEGQPKLWTYDFTVLTLGSFVSIVGACALSYALGIYILDIFHSNVLYSATLSIGHIAGIAVPIVASAFVEKISKRKIIFTLDFITAGVLVVMFVLCRLKLISVAVVIVYCLIDGLIANIYTLAYDSYVPRIVAPDNYSRAYSITGVILTMAESGVLIGTFFYHRYGLESVLAFSAVFYFVAAIFEHRMKYDDVTESKENTLKENLRDIREAAKYVISKKGLLSLNVIDMILCFNSGAFFALVLPLFMYEMHWRIDGEYMYMIVMGFLSTGQVWGGAIGYKINFEPENRAKACILMLLFEPLAEILFPFCPSYIMAGLMFITGITGILESAIRRSTIYGVLPESITAKYVGFELSTESIAYILGTMLAGWLSEIFSARIVISVIALLSFTSISLVAWRVRKELAVLFRHKPADIDEFL